MPSKKRIGGGLVGLLVLSFGIHYALFGSLPIGKPTLLEDDEN